MAKTAGQVGYTHSASVTAPQDYDLLVPGIDRVEVGDIYYVDFQGWMGVPKGSSTIGQTIKTSYLPVARHVLALQLGVSFPTFLAGSAPPSQTIPITPAPVPGRWSCSHKRVPEDKFCPVCNFMGRKRVET